MTRRLLFGLGCVAAFVCTLTIGLAGFAADEPTHSTRLAPARRTAPLAQEPAAERPRLTRSPRTRSLADSVSLDTRMEDVAGTNPRTGERRSRQSVTVTVHNLRAVPIRVVYLKWRNNGLVAGQNVPGSVAVAASGDAEFPMSPTGQDDDDEITVAAVVYEDGVEQGADFSLRTARAGAGARGQR